VVDPAQNDGGDGEAAAAGERFSSGDHSMMTKKRLEGVVEREQRDSTRSLLTHSWWLVW
jgi:hypothetical protein